MLLFRCLRQVVYSFFRISVWVIYSEQQFTKTIHSVCIPQVHCFCKVFSSQVQIYICPCARQIHAAEAIIQPIIGHRLLDAQKSLIRQCIPFLSRSCIYSSPAPIRVHFSKLILRISIRPFFVRSRYGKQFECVSIIFFYTLSPIVLPSKSVSRKWIPGSHCLCKPLCGLFIVLFYAMPKRIQLADSVLPIAFLLIRLLHLQKGIIGPREPVLRHCFIHTASQTRQVHFS